MIQSAAAARPLVPLVKLANLDIVCQAHRASLVKVVAKHALLERSAPSVLLEDTLVRAAVDHVKLAVKLALAALDAPGATLVMISAPPVAQSLPANFKVEQ